MNTISEQLKYASTHEWVRTETDGVVSVGISDFAQAQLGDVVFLELPAPGRQVRAGEAVAVIESVKTASDIHSLLPGEIVEVNQALKDAPEAINDDSLAAWLFRLKVVPNATEWAALLDDTGYARLTENV